MTETAPAKGPDFSSGIALSKWLDDGTLSGRVGDTAVLLSRIDGEFFAISATCTHYGGDLAEGHIGRSEVRCPLHHACFDLKTGAVLRAPALDPLDRWRVEIEGERLFVREKLPSVSKAQPIRTDVQRIVIIGGGAAGLACAVELRKLGYEGALTILSDDQDAPYDRPNLSKDYLAGTAEEKWMPLREDDWYRDNRIDLRLNTEVDAIDTERREVRCNSTQSFPFDRLLIATGSEPRRLERNGFSGARVFTLRSFADARSIIEKAKPNSTAVILGSSFIGLEAASALRKRNVSVTIVAPESVPFERVFGRELGALLQALHEDHGVRFHLGNSDAKFESGEVVLANGTHLPADFVLVGAGVTPRTGLAEAAGLTVKDGVWVDEYLKTSCADIFAAGDIAAYPDPITGKRVRVEHWTVAERQGQIAAANMLGAKHVFASAPFFWTEQHGVTVRYVGHATRWDETRRESRIDTDDCILRYYREGRHLATATINRNRVSLEDELQLEATSKD